MDLARYEAMDAQRFDPMRQKKTLSNLAIPRTEEDMGQIIRRMSQPPKGVVGGTWNDHELVLVPLEVSSLGAPTGSVLSESPSSASSSSRPTSSASSSSTYFSTSSPPTAESGTEVETPPSSSSTTGLRQADTFDREDLIVTRTIIRPGTQSSLRGMLSRPSSPTFSRPPSRPNTPVFQALNCFRPNAFKREVEEGEREVPVATQPVLQVIVTQTREQYERDLAFKEVVQAVYPEASRRRRPLH